ncbi:MAG: DNA-3-methyladenine glycosylase 2 family protein [Pseudomonadota bacterium]|nr:DNA-3-methyladenine glycosylase 2 family protein [Pseudomonadota bacterium]
MAAPVAAPAPPLAARIPGVTPKYWTKAKRALSAADPTMRSIIAAHPRGRLESRGDAFVTLVRSIVGQQISVKAAAAIWTRFCAACGETTPKAILRRRATTLRRCGLSDRKVEYIRDLAAHFVSGRVDPSLFDQQGDEEIIEELIDIRGIGRWTAEMFLIFNLLRPDVLPLDDLGLLKAVSLHYLDGAPVVGRDGRARVNEIAAMWAPWRSVATWYLWRSLDPVPVTY